jgi:hypothetical protein
METITVNQVVEDDRKLGWLSAAILNMISDKFAEIIPEGAEKQIEIEIKFNGVEVSFTDFIDRLAKSYDESVKRAALNLLKEKLGDLTDVVYKIEQYATDTAKNILNVYDTD